VNTVIDSRTTESIPARSFCTGSVALAVICSATLAFNAHLPDVLSQESHFLRQCLINGIIAEVILP
jgi:hypothetical protein